VEAKKAERVVAEELAVFEAWFNALAVVPTIVALRGKMEGIVRGELERSAHWLGEMSTEDRSRIEGLAASVVNKILHDPITGLKAESIEKDELPYVAAVRRLFKL
jgi:glutamyl-tRNA reductase